MRPCQPHETGAVFAFGKSDLTSVFWSCISSVNHLPPAVRDNPVPRSFCYFCFCLLSGSIWELLL